MNLKEIDVSQKACKQQKKRRTNDGEKTEKTKQKKQETRDKQKE